MWYNVCHVNNDSVGNLVFRKKMIRIIGKIRKKVILIDNFIQSFYLFCVALTLLQDIYN